MADSSGNGNTGTVSGATWTAAGKYGSALSFNGSSARVNIPNSVSLQLSGGMTLEAWVDPTSVTSAWRDVLYKGNDNYYLEATSSPGGVPGGGGIVGGGYGEVYGPTKLTANSWAYLSLTYDGTALRLYVNGSLVSTTAKTGTLATSTNQLQIGGDSLYGQYFNGLIDEVRVYNTALSAGQIQTDMAIPISGGTSDTQPPTQPGTLSANAASSSTINLSWGASTDNVGVTGYRIERCQGSGCSNFSQIATTTGSTTTYSDTSLSANTSYSYRVRATDAAGNTSPYSNTATTTTPNPADTTPPSQPGTLSANAASQQHDQPLLGRLQRQRRRHRLPDRTLPRQRLLQLQPDRHHHRQHHHLQRHQPHRQHQLQLPRPRHRRRQQHQPLQQHRHHHHTSRQLWSGCGVFVW